MAVHRFALTANWNGGLGGSGQIGLGQRSYAISVPSELGGPGEGTNPEEMLLGAAASCYMITLGALLERLGIQRVELTSELHVSSNPSMRVERLIHRPVIAIPDGFSAERMEKVRKSAIRAEQACMISRALKGNVEVLVEPVFRQESDPE